MSWLKDMPGGWRVLSGDVNWSDYGASWCKRGTDGAWWIVDFESCEEWGDGASGYYASVKRVELNAVSLGVMQGALRSCGMELTYVGVITDDGKLLHRESEEIYEMTLLDVLHSYGVYAPMYDVYGRYSIRVRAQARRMAEELMADAEKTQLRLQRPVNKLGATAADFARGDSLAHLRSKADTILRDEPVTLTPEDSVVLRCYAAGNGRTIGGQNETVLAAAGRTLIQDDDHESENA